MNETKHHQKNQPVKKFRSGALTATVWRNETNDTNGNVTEYSTVTFERSYKDKNDMWKTTNSLRVNDLPRAALVLQKAYEYLALQKEEGVA
ncbi:hypothetical protein D6783_04940 [Candidatus Woesearchaeota archaeon]|nr:MAG: hypothetical protein D6783_04940 [Candidatus Woesearchaeota archaeon]